MSGTAFSLMLLGYTVNRGPLVEDKYMRFAIAGTAATVIVELVTHAVDTVNMRSKVINGPKIYVVNFMRVEGITQLFKGVQAVLYGYVFSSIVYFYSYAYLKESFKVKFEERNEKKADAKALQSGNPVTALSHKITFVQTLAASFVASATSEILALWFYYPFDLIKTRMQTSNDTYKYRNLVDAFHRVLSTDLSAEERIKQRSDWFTRIQRLYSGMSLYSLTFVTFIAIEFSLYDSLLV